MEDYLFTVIDIMLEEELRQHPELFEDVAAEPACAAPAAKEAA